MALVDAVVCCQCPRCDSGHSAAGTRTTTKEDASVGLVVVVVVVVRDPPLGLAVGRFCGCG